MKEFISAIPIFTVSSKKKLLQQKTQREEVYRRLPFFFQVFFGFNFDFINSGEFPWFLLFSFWYFPLRIIRGPRPGKTQKQFRLHLLRISVSFRGFSACASSSRLAFSEKEPQSRFQGSLFFLFQSRFCLFKVNPKSSEAQKGATVFRIGLGEVSESFNKVQILQFF